MLKASALPTDHLYLMGVINFHRGHGDDTPSDPAARRYPRNLFYSLTTLFILEEGGSGDIMAGQRGRDEREP